MAVCFSFSPEAYHLYPYVFLCSVLVDASDSCNVVNFNIGSSAGTTRQWDIKATQYLCGAEMAGTYHKSTASYTST